MEDYEIQRATDKRMSKLQESRQYHDLIFTATQLLYNSEGNVYGAWKKVGAEALTTLVNHYPNELLSQISLIRHCNIVTQAALCDKITSIEKHAANGTVLNGIADYYWQRGEKQKAINLFRQALDRQNISNFPITAAYLEQMDKSLRDPSHPRNYAHLQQYWSYYAAIPVNFGAYGKMVREICDNKENRKEWTLLCLKAAEKLAANKEFGFASTYAKKAAHQLPNDERLTWDEKANDWREKKEQLFNNTQIIEDLDETKIFSFLVNPALPDGKWQQYLEDIVDQGELGANTNLNRYFFAK